MVLWAADVLISTEQLHRPPGVLIKTHSKNELSSARWWRRGYGEPILNRRGPRHGGGEYRSLPCRQAQASRQLPGSRRGHWALSVHWPVKGTSLNLPRLITVASQVDRTTLLKISVPCDCVCLSGDSFKKKIYIYIDTMLIYSPSLCIGLLLCNSLSHTSPPSCFLKIFTQHLVFVSFPNKEIGDDGRVWPLPRFHSIFLSLKQVALCRTLNKSSCNKQSFNQNKTSSGTEEGNPELWEGCVQVAVK